VSITALSATKIETTWHFAATSSLSGAVFYWYVDGLFWEASGDGTFRFAAAVDEWFDVEPVDSDDDDFDPHDPDNNPTPSAARRSVCWIRSLAENVRGYRIEQKKGAGAYATLLETTGPAGLWWWEWRTGRLDDLADYTWRITPVDTLGNDGTPVVVGPESIVRRPDPPDFEIAYNAGAETVTFSEAS